MPIYNNADHLKEALSSILNQNYKDFRLNIIDDCSNDNSEKICKEIVKNDTRVYFSKNKKNLGGSLNFSSAFQKAINDNCKYFLYARGDAFYSAGVLGKCIKYLEKNKNAVLAYPIPNWVNSDSDVIEKKHISYYSSEDCNMIYRSILSIWNKPFQLYGLIRTDIIKPFYLNNKLFIGHDNAFVFYLSLNGYFGLIKDENWYRRFNYKNESYHLRMERYKNNFLKDNQSFSSKYPNMFLAFKMIEIILNFNCNILMKLILILIAFFNAPLRLIYSYGKSI